ncbi:hypothetical protein [Corynebacterium tapiri]|uniref:Uncharacterized protein n=1 Tax=Corynebacterium tapiri TaxID=1448266 RepID=A0A5C4U140_9CORY|nr:hypothetical protein [Corynebacterium tapiri]TNL94605.1 hypothetical protein FHE74_10325 [Corynebacterium tapiri]
MTPAIILQTISIILVAFGTSIALYKVYAQNQFERRNTWWKRTEWALDKIASDNEADVYIGSTLLPVILESSFRDAQDKDLSQAIIELTTEDTPPNEVESKQETSGGEGHGDTSPNQ